MQHLDPETISSYIDGELSTEEIAQVETHLASCQQCQQERRELLAVSRMIREVPVYQPRISALVKDRPAKLPAGVVARFIRPLAVAAIVILAAVTGLVVISEIIDPEPGGTDDERSSSQSVADVPGPTASDDEAPKTTLQEAQDPPASGQLAVATEEAGNNGNGAPSIAREIRIALYVALGAIVAGAAVWLHVQRTRRT
jgi:anti-sigma factor RsiW